MPAKKLITKHLPRGVRIIHEDRDILVIHKPAGLLSMGTDREKENTAYYAMTDYVRKGQIKSKNRIFIVHRLDRDVSGLLLFAKTPEAKNGLQEQWADAQKNYYAIVHGHMPQPTGTITSYLLEDAVHRTRSTRDTVKGKLSHTAWTVLKEIRDFTLLDVALLTGRKNQIRAHLAEDGHPIVGDRKYGPGAKGHKFLALHAHTLTIHHPYTRAKITFESKPPGYLIRLIGGLPKPPDTPEDPMREGAEGD